MPSKVRGKSEATSKDEDIGRSKIYKSFRSKNKNQNQLKTVLNDKSELQKQPRTQSIEWAKQKTPSLKA